MVVVVVCGTNTEVVATIWLVVVVTVVAKLELGVTVDVVRTAVDVAVNVELITVEMAVKLPML